jgi:copper chaperone
MSTMTVWVPEIHCDHCKHSLEGALAPLPGVRAAEVDVTARTITLDVDEAQVDRGQVIAAIQEQGYDVPTR